MSLEMIKAMKAEVEALKLAQENSKTEAEKIREELKEATATRKADFTADPVMSEKEVASAASKLKGLYLNSKILDRPLTEMKGFKEAASVIEKAVKPSDIASWAAEEFSNDVIEKLEHELMVANLFPTLTMPDSRQTLSIPARTGNLSAYLIAPAADAVESAITGGKVSFEVKKFKAFSAIADESDPELVTAVTDLTQMELVRSIARGMENAVINGDTAFATANDVRKAFDGLRKFANANAVDMGGAVVTAAKINATRKAMGIWGINQNDLALLVSPSAYFQLLDVEQFQTVDKFGPMATVVAGEVGKVFGIPVIVSEYIAEDLETSGADNAGTGATTQAVLVNKNYFAMVARGGVVVERDRNIIAGVENMVASRHLTFGKLYTAGTPIAALVNVAV